MRKRSIYLLIFISLYSLLLTGFVNETTFLKESTKKENQAIERTVQKYMKNCYAQNGFSGAVLVANDHDVLLDKGYGMSDYEKKTTNKPHTVFEIGSVTKQFTATAIMMLQEKGLLNVKDPIYKYIPDYPKGNKIKIYNLLTHTSGLPEYLQFVKSLESVKHTYTPKALIELFKNKPLDFKIGTRFQYSNSNYILLGYIIEKVSGMKYEDFIKRNIFKPLRMNNTGFLSNQAPIKDKAIGYSMIDQENNAYTKSSEMESSLPYSAGEIYSTVEDLYKWNNALFTEKLIKKESLNKMFTPDLEDYGFGWRIKKASDESKIVFHGGNIPGYTAFIERNINKKNTIIILSNMDSDNTNIGNIASGLSKIIDAKN